MKTCHILISLSLVLVEMPLAQAAIEAIGFAPDGDGVILMPPENVAISGLPADAAVVTMAGNHTELSSGHLRSDIQATDPWDPKITFRAGMNNDSGAAWSAYRVSIYMSKAFTLSDPLVYLPGNWNGTIVRQGSTTVTLDDSVEGGFLFGGTAYLGELLFNGPTPVAVSEMLDFAYTLEFSGAYNYALIQEMTPVVVPEVACFGWIGGFVIFGYALQRRCRGFVGAMLSAPRRLPMNPPSVLRIPLRMKMD